MSVIVRVAVRVPAAAGVKVMDTEQFWFNAKVEHPLVCWFVWENSLLFTPLMVMPEMMRFAFPVFCTVRASAELETVTS